MLEPGTTVLLQNRVKGRNNIQDCWDSTPYNVIGIVRPDSSAYLVQKYDGNGPIRAINRVDLLEFPVEETEMNSKLSDKDSSTDEDIHSDQELHHSISVATKPPKTIKEVNSRKTLKSTIIS